MHRGSCTSTLIERMKTPLRILLAVGIAAQSLPAFAEGSSEYDKHFFDQSEVRDGKKQSLLKSRTHTDGRPRTKELRSNLTAVPPIKGNSQQTPAQAKATAAAKAKTPHLFWDWDKTVTASVAGLAGAALGFMVGGPIGAAVGFVLGVVLGAIAANMKPKEEAAAAPAS